MSKWTEEQLAAIDTTGCDILVAAAAGSGKTAVLVERIIKKVTNKTHPVDIDKLLVVTFTNSAASEMRQKIANALSLKLAENPLDSHIQKQMILLNNASITTIHSFCLSVVRQNFNKLNIDPSFRIADQTELTLIQSELLQELFEELYSNGNNNWFLSLVESYSETTFDSKLYGLVLKIYEFIQSYPYPIEWLYENIEMFNLSDDYSLDNSSWSEIYRKHIEFESLGALNACDCAIELCEEPSGPFHYMDTLQSDKMQIINILDNISSSFDKLYKAVVSFDFSYLSRKRPRGIDPFLKDEVKRIRDNDMKKVIINLKNKLFFKPIIEMGNKTVTINLDKDVQICTAV